MSEQAVYWPLIAARLASLTLLIIIAILLKPHPRPGKIATPWILAVGVLDTLGNVFFAFATRAGRLDISAILCALYPATTVLLAYIFLHERLSIRQWLGVALAFLAVGLIAS